MSAFELAQLNIGVIKGSMESPLMADFADNLDRINALAEATPGFVWRLQTLEHLRAHGPGPQAFTFRHASPAPDAAPTLQPLSFGSEAARRRCIPELVRVLGAAAPQE